MHPVRHLLDQRRLRMQDQRPNFIMRFGLKREIRRSLSRLRERQARRDPFLPRSHAPWCLVLFYGIFFVRYKSQPLGPHPLDVRFQSAYRLYLRIKFVKILGSRVGRDTPALRPAFLHFKKNAMFLARTRMVCKPSRSFSTSSGSDP